MRKELRLGDFSGVLGKDGDETCSTLMVASEDVDITEGAGTGDEGGGLDSDWTFRYGSRTRCAVVSSTSSLTKRFSSAKVGIVSRLVAGLTRLCKFAVSNACGPFRNSSLLMKGSSSF